MVSKLSFVALIAVVLAVGMVLCVSASTESPMPILSKFGFSALNEQQGGISTDKINPAAGMATIKSVQWYKNGISQGKIIFDPVGNAYVTVEKYDTISFKVIALYQGSGTGYGAFVWPTETPSYVETWPLKSGIITTKSVTRAYHVEEDRAFYVFAEPPGAKLDFSSPIGEARAIYVKIL